MQNKNIIEKKLFIKRFIPDDVCLQRTDDIWRNKTGFGNPFFIFAEYGFGGPIMQGFCVVYLSKKPLRYILELESMSGEVVAHIERKITWEEIRKMKHIKEYWLDYLGDDKEGVTIQGCKKFTNQVGVEITPRIHIADQDVGQASDIRSRLMGKRARDLDELLREKRDLTLRYQRKMEMFDREIQLARDKLLVTYEIHKVKEKTKKWFQFWKK